MGRHNLYMFRCDMKLTQEEIAAKIGVTRATYAGIETGKRSGRNYFWEALQKAYDIPDAKMWDLMKTE